MYTAILGPEMLSVIRDAIPLIIKYTLMDSSPPDLNSLMLINKEFNRATTELYPEILRNRLMVEICNCDLSLIHCARFTTIKTTTDGSPAAIDIQWGLQGIIIKYRKAITVIAVYKRDRKTNHPIHKYSVAICPYRPAHEQLSGNLKRSLLMFLARVFPLLSFNLNKPLQLVM